MLKNLAKLIDVKSLTTLFFVLVLCFITVYGVLHGQAPTDLFNNAVMLVLGFFFGKVTTAQVSENKKEETK